MRGAAILVVQVASSLGWGFLGLRLLRLDEFFRRGERAAMAFALGFGILGALAFPLGVAGLLIEAPLLVLLLVGLPGLALIEKADWPRLERPDATGGFLLALLGVVLALDILGAIAPPADADTLAYHFATPKLFLQESRIVFLPRVADGAVPLLVQMTYLPALSLGGELALTLWTTASGWAVVILLFVLARRHVSQGWALALALVLVTKPAVVYGINAGQVELRIVLFVLLSAWAVAEARRSGHTGLVLLAGFGAGFYAASKYIGLLFVVAAGLCLLFDRQWLRNATLFGIAAIVSGAPWYAWNALHTGDPFFPMAFQWLGRDGLPFWSLEIDHDFKAWFFPAERAVPRSVWWLFAYPFKATLDPHPIFESERVGFGPYAMLVLPFAVLGAWQGRERLLASPLAVYVAIAALSYTLWFFTGSSQRISHLLPILPLVLLAATAAAARFAAVAPLRWSLVAAAILTVSLQLAGHGVYSFKFTRYVATGFDRESFLLSNVSGYAPVPWINQNLEPTDRVLVRLRQLHYHLDVPWFFGTDMAQSVVELRPGRTDASRLSQQLRAEGINHLLITRVGDTYDAPFDLLKDAGCLDLVRSFASRHIASRTLSGGAGTPATTDLFRLAARPCPAAGR